jgi:hypothetical protein
MCQRCHLRYDSVHHQRNTWLLKGEQIHER